MIPLRCGIAFLFAIAAILPLSHAHAQAVAPTQGASCSGVVTAGAINGSTTPTTVVQPAAGNNLVCVSGTWQYPAYQFGSTAASCNSTNAGAVQWTGSAFQGCDGSAWRTLTPGLGFVGMLTMVGKSACNWAITTSWASMAANSSCNSLTSSGSATSPGKYPAIQFASLPAGTYKVTFNIAYDNSAGCAFRISDGTNSAGEAHVISTTGDYVSGIFTYATAQTNITFSLQGKSSSSSSCTVYGDAATTGLSVTDFTYSFYVERIL